MEKIIKILRQKVTVSLQVLQVSPICYIK